MPKLTKTEVEKQLPGEQQRFVWDTDLKGFGVKIFPTGAKTFVFQYRTREGRSKRLTIGKFSDVLTVEQARKEARKHYAAVVKGGDPQGDKQARREAPTLADVFDAYLASDAFQDKAASTRAIDEGRINRHLRPLLGNLYADKLTTKDVARAHRAIVDGKTTATIATKPRGQARVRGGDGTARKAVILLRAICRWSAREGTPAGIEVVWENIKTSKDGIRETIIEDADTYRRLFATLDRMQNENRIRDAVADAFRFIALTGARRGEVAGLLWKYVDLRHGRVVLPPTAHKTGHGTGKPRIIALPAAAQVIIARQPDGGPDAYVFEPAKGNGGALTLSKDWRRVREEAGLPDDLGLHGLRHSVATHLAMAGASLVEVMTQMGHRQASTSQRYIHYAERARSTLAERAAAVALAGLDRQGEKAEVVQLKRGRK